MIGGREVQPDQPANDAFASPLLILGDCLQEMAAIHSGSVQLVLADLPYGCTKARWDQPLDLQAFWAETRRVLAKDGTVVAFGAGLFTAQLMVSAPDLFKQSLIWRKTRPTGFIQAASKHLASHEDILVFSQGGIGVRAKKPMTYNPQGLKPIQGKSRNGAHCSLYSRTPTRWRGVQTHTNYTRSVLEFESPTNSHHQTEKPVPLLQYLIRTFSNPGDLILDPTMGSGSAGVAAIAEDRRFIGIERDQDIMAVAQNRIAAISQDQTEAS